MKCDGCGEDKCYWTELWVIRTLDKTPNHGSIFHPTSPKDLLYCDNCYTNLTNYQALLLKTLLKS